MTYFLLTAIWFNSQSVGYWPVEEPHPIIKKCNGKYVVIDIYAACN